MCVFLIRTMQCLKKNVISNSKNYFLYFISLTAQKKLNKHKKKLNSNFGTSYLCSE